ncbi:MAG: MBL fold metallo-hydrolase [Phycisphaeraceae bacterium]|nr:MBL fold metallo-hydrolase [Phycisphaerales bacterium]MCB9860168.1 MBL fold metallo-hydrolase [Phycisphaeraceae bacterium]
MRHPMQSRRSFLLLAGSAVVSSPLLSQAAGVRRRYSVRRDAWFEWNEVQPGAFVAIGEGGNALAINTGAEAVLIDAKNAPFGPVIAREASERAGGPIKLLISTHHHADHTGGNYAFKDAQKIMFGKALPRIDAQVERYTAQIKAAIDNGVQKPDDVADAMFVKVSEEIAGLRDRVDALTEKDFRPANALPDFFFGANPLPIGDIELKLQQFGAGHTDNDVVVEIPTLNVIHTGDLVFHGMHPYFDPEGGSNSAEWIKSLENVEKLCDAETVVVPGHGDVSDVSCVKKQIEYMQQLRETVREAVDAGKSKEETQALRPAFFEGLARGQLGVRALGAVYDEMKRPESERGEDR